MATQYLFFSGKGGVGKTTMACATAVAEADTGRRTLIVTTDPASNLADVFEQPIGHQVTAIEGVENLWAMEIDPDKATEEYRDHILGPFRAVMPDEVLRVLEEQFRSPCTTEIASFDRFVDFMDEDRFDLVIFDTAPTGHTIRLLELPVDWSAYIEESAKGGGQTCMGPVQAIQASKVKYDRAIALLSNADRTRFVFVLQTEQTAIFETERSVSELERLGVHAQKLIVNRILPAEVCDRPFFAKRYEMQQRHLEEIRRLFPHPTRYMLLRDHEVKGVSRLRDVAAALEGHAASAPGEAPAAVPAATLGDAGSSADSAQVARLLTLPFDYSQQVELMVTTTQDGNALRSETRARFDRMIARLQDPERTTFAFVLHPEFTPMVEAHRAMLDLKAAGIPTQLVVANQVIPATQATNPFFARRRAMQMRYLSEIERNFAAPVVTLPLLDREIHGLSTVGEVATLLFGDGDTDENARSARGAVRSR